MPNNQRYRKKTTNNQNYIKEMNNYHYRKYKKKNENL